jgi:hypothetical protein
MKTSPLICRGLLLTLVLGCMAALSAHAQSAPATPAPVTTQVTPTSPPPAKGIGPAPANTPQHQILNTALSPETRQTLQQAMNSTPAK